MPACNEHLQRTPETFLEKESKHIQNFTNVGIRTKLFRFTPFDVYIEDNNIQFLRKPPPSARSAT